MRIKMNIPEIKHYPNCRADYPEKPVGEKPQQIEITEIDGDTVYTCVDCGAFVYIEGSK